MVRITLCPGLAERLPHRDLLSHWRLQTVLFAPSVRLSLAPSGGPSYVCAVHQQCGFGVVVATAKHVDISTAWVGAGLAAFQLLATGLVSPDIRMPKMARHQFSSCS
jgi:hypothetical protein